MEQGAAVMTNRSTPISPLHTDRQDGIYCAFCPYHNDYFWLKLKRDDPARCQECVELDQVICNGVSSIHILVFLSKSCMLLAEVDFEVLAQGDGFGEECCGYGGL